MVKYVVAVSDDEVSAYAFTWASKYLFAEGDSVTIITAKFSDSSLPSADITAGEYAVPVPVTDLAEAEKLATAKAAAVVDKYLKLCEQSKLEGQGKVVDGSPGSHIVAEAEEIGANAIVLGSHGKGLVARTLLGSISDYVRHHTSLPVVVVRFPKDNQDALAHAGLPRKIVVAVDETPEAAHAFSWALQHLVKEQDGLFVLHIQNTLAAPTTTGTDQLGMEDVYVPPDTTGRASVEALGQSEKLVETFMKQAADTTKAKCEGRVVSGITQDKLLHELITLKADLVVVGSHERDALQRTFLGSVSDYIAHNSPCAAIFVKLGTSGTAAGGSHAHAG